MKNTLSDYNLTEQEVTYLQSVRDLLEDKSTVKTAAPILSIGGGAIGMAARVATPVTAALPTAAAIALPSVGNAIGGGYSAAEHLVNEDELKTEKLKAIIMKYKMLTARLDREISRRHSTEV